MHPEDQEAPRRRRHSRVSAELSNEPIDQPVPWGYVSVMIGLAVLAVGGQLSSLWSLVGFSHTKHEWEATAETRSQIQEELHRIRTELASDRATMQSVKNEAEMAETTHLELQAKLKEARDRLAVAQTEESEARASRTDLLSQATSLTKQITDRQVKVRSINETLAELGSQMSSRQADLDRIGTEHAKSTETLRQLTATLDTTQEQLTARQNELIDGNREYAALQQRLTTAKDTIAKGTALEDWIRQNQPIADQLESDIKSRTARKDILDTQLKAVRAQWQQTLTDKQTLEQDLQKQRSRLDSLKEDVLKRETSKKSLEDQSRRLEEAITQLETQKKLLQDELSNRTSLLEDLPRLRQEEARLRPAQLELAKVKADVARWLGMRRELNGIEGQLEEKREEHDQLEGKLKSLRQQVETQTKLAQGANAELIRSFKALTDELAKAVRNLQRAAQAEPPATRNGEDK
jgi:putative ABC transport system permease protein